MNSMKPARKPSPTFRIFDNRAQAEQKAKEKAEKTKKKENESLYAPLLCCLVGSRRCGFGQLPGTLVVIMEVMVMTMTTMAGMEVMEVTGMEVMEVLKTTTKRKRKRA